MNGNGESSRAYASPEEPPDLLVIGGGVNGSGVARDAAGRGLSVVLCEKEDLAAHTSSSSTKLIHGGLRYLEHFDFLLVRSSLKEREALLKIAPHIIWPLRFILPYDKRLRPRWLLRLGLFIYDHIGGRKRLPKSHSVKLAHHDSGPLLKPQFVDAFEYSDCWVQDARLVVLNARDAADRGATILTRTRCNALKRTDATWEVTLVDEVSGESATLYARAVVNASGPWVGETTRLHKESEAEGKVRLVKGSHVVVPKLFEHGYSYILQHTDGRVLFAIPFEGDFTLLGTTDIDFQGDIEKVAIDRAEIDYIFDAINYYFRIPLNPADIVWSYSGVRSLFNDESKNVSKVTRDYQLQLDEDGAPLLSVFGGKITTYRKLSEQVIDLLAKHLGTRQPPWTAQRPLPGGDIDAADFDRFLAACRQRYPWMETQLLDDYARNYGTRIAQILQQCRSKDDLGEHFGGGLYAREVHHLMTQEWAMTGEDVLWRSTKKGLRLTAEQAQQLEQWMNEHRPARASLQRAMSR